MRNDTLEFLRCPYCGGRFELDTSQFHNRGADAIHDGILACQCCNLPVVDGIPVLHLLPDATAALDHLRAARPDRARGVMFGLDDEARAEAFDAVAASSTATYREIVEALGPGFEGGYFLYRFSDPTYLVAQAVVHAVASTVLGGNRRAVDICGGSGHVTRTLTGLTSEPPVLADLYFAKVWLARRFTAPGCEPVCCDGNAPMPFARGAFAFAMCTDAFMYIWTKRQFVGEMERLIDRGQRGSWQSGSGSSQLQSQPGRWHRPAMLRGRFSSATRTTSGRGARRTASRSRPRATPRCSKPSSRASSASSSSSPTWSAADPSISHGARIRRRSTPTPR